MHVVIATRIYAPEPSAASFMLEAVAQAFHNAGHDVTVLTTRPQRGVSINDVSGITVRRARVLRDSSGYVRGYLPYLSFDVPLLFRILLGRRADLYFVEPPPTTGAVVRMAAALKGRPYFYDAADIWSDAAKLATSFNLMLRLLRSIEIFAMSGAQRAFTISQGVSDRMDELGIQTPTTVIGFGVDSSAFQYEPVVDGRYFVYAGTFSEWHGADILVDAFARFSAGRSGYRLLFIGNGTDRKLIERKRDELGLANVEILDPMNAHSLNRVLARATASLATLKPGQGYDYAFTTKVYASIAAGCPVLFAGVGPTAPFLTEANLSYFAGVSVDYEIDAIAAAMGSLANEPVPADQRQALSDWARGAFSLRAVAENVVRTVEQSIRKN